ncbi:glutaredoxin family protein [Candidatus Woesearchaeota archaeon]|nr:glutaredoxin family protein [Candidatus Woesearchaeota archaeon]
MVEKSKKQHEVKVYSLPTCVHCNHTKEFFKKHNVKYQDINVQDNKNAAKEMVEKTGQHGVPVIVIDGKWDDAVIGFDEKGLRKILGIK